MSDRGKCEACGTCDRGADECSYCAEGEGGCYSWRNKVMAQDCIGSWLHDDAAIVVLPFHRAPYVLQKLSECGGDEDWITLYKTASHTFTPYWVENLGCCSNDQYELGPYTMWIASHA